MPTFVNSNHFHKIKGIGKNHVAGGGAGGGGDSVTYASNSRTVHNVKMHTYKYPWSN